MARWQSVAGPGSAGVSYARYRLVRDTGPKAPQRALTVMQDINTGEAFALPITRVSRRQALRSPICFARDPILTHDVLTHDIFAHDCDSIGASDVTTPVNSKEAAA